MSEDCTNRPVKTLISKVFDELAILLELKGENPFRVRAFSSASRIAANSELSNEVFLQALKEGNVKGFGPQLKELALSIAQTGESPYLLELREEFPEGLLYLLKLPGLGVKKLKTLYEELNISDIDQLEKACQEDKLSSLKGFGKKTQQKFLAACLQFQTYKGSLRYDQAKRKADALIEYLEDSPLCSRIEAVGELRRNLEIISCISLLALSSEPEGLISRLLEFPEISSATDRRKYQASVQLRSGIMLHLFIVPENDYASALVFHTGSEEHLRTLSTATQKKAFVCAEDLAESLPENRVFESEHEVFEALGLAYIPPERREDSNDIAEAFSAFASREELPQLVSLADIKGILHVHSSYSDGANSVEELATAVKQMGYQYLGISDHSKTAAYAGGLATESIYRQHEEIDRLNEKLAPFHIFKGIESDILADASLDYPDSVLETFDFVIASIHSRHSMSQELMTQRIVSALENPFTTILGHPTGRLLLERKEYALDLEEVFAAAARSKAAIEINSSPKRLDLDWRHHQRAKALGISLAICPDAHSIKGLADIAFGVGIARKGGLSKKDILTCWDREELSLFFKKCSN